MSDLETHHNVYTLSLRFESLLHKMDTFSLLILLTESTVIQFKDKLITGKKVGSPIFHDF